MAILDRFRTAWNVFTRSDQQTLNPWTGTSYSIMSDMPRSQVGGGIGDKTTLTAIYNRIAVDFSSIDLWHVQTDAQGRYSGDVRSGLNEVLTFEANIDQGPTDYRRAACLEMLTAGAVAIVPVNASVDPLKNTINDVYSVRVGTILEYYPKHVRVRVFNEDKGTKEEIKIPKTLCPIVQNPFYAVMNQPNSTLKRLAEKLNLLDFVDKASGSGKLDLIIQLPFVVRSSAQKKQAQERQSALEEQLRDSTYGIAYTDATEKITQLNRPVENGLLDQIKSLTAKLYDELGLTPEILNQSASESVMTLYHGRVIWPIAEAFSEALQRVFLGRQKTASGQRIYFARTTIPLSPITALADVIDALSRNEIVTPNEVRGWLGLKPDTSPDSDKLMNSNMPAKVPPEQLNRKSQNETR